MMNTLNKVFTALLAAALTACGEPPAPPETVTRAAQQTAAPTATPAPPAVSDDEWNARLARALAAVRKEKQVRDASWLNERPASLLAGVIDDGSRQDGYAQYLCSVLADHELHGGTVRVMDVAAAVRNEWRELGKADCPTSAEVTFIDFTKGVK